MRISLSLPLGFRLNRMLLLAGNMLAGVALIVLQNVGVLPLSNIHFTFFSFLGFLFALYRPGWTFLLLVGMLPFETLRFAMPAAGLIVRPYQWLLVILFLALLFRLIGHRLPFKLFRPGWFDALPILIIAGSFFALGNAVVPMLALKQTLVVVSLVGLYFLGRIFFRTLVDVRQALPFFLSSSLVVFGYALWQSIRFFRGQESFMVMAGRPNSTFSEADWLGLFSVFLLALLLSLTILFIKKTWGNGTLRRVFWRFLKERTFWILFCFQVLAWIILLITVSRSAWLGAALVCLGAFFAFLLYHGWSGLRTLWPASFFFAGNGVIAFLVALLMIGTFHLTPFHLFERAASTGGSQKITVSCMSDVITPARIGTVEELPSGCVHIRLEDIEQEKQAGNTIYEILRDDPNVAVRQQIYRRVWPLIQEHPWRGIGWGSVTSFLGTDERGAGLNASNVFLEVWLGSGLLGFVSFLILVLGIFVAAVKGYVTPNEEGERIFALFLFLALVGMFLFDMFNSGLLLGFFFLFLALGVLNIERVGFSIEKK